MKEQDLKGRHALVTGAGRGIGRAIVLELAGRGAKVMACGREAAKIQETIQLGHKAGFEVVPLVGDITEPGFAESCARTGHPIDVVVHNATSFPAYAPIEETESRAIALVHEVAVFAPMRITARLMPDMRARGFGRIVFIGSIAATLGAAQQSPYASAKAALQGLVKSLALEGARDGVTCNLVEPGLVLTERVLAVIPEVRRALLVGRTPMGRPGTPEEIAAVVGFLASPRASYVTGACIPVTGGFGLGLT